MSERIVMVYARHGTLCAPVLRVAHSRDDQVVIALCLPSVDRHVTLHERQGEPILLTIYMSDKPHGTWDDTKVELAKKLGYRNPERHGKYLSHLPLHPIQNVDGYPLVGFHVELFSAQDKPKYARRERIEIDAPSESFTLWTYLSRPEFPIDSPAEPHVNTPLEELYFRFD